MGRKYTYCKMMLQQMMDITETYNLIIPYKPVSILSTRIKLINPYQSYQPVSTCINPFHPISTHLNLYQSVSTFINPQQPIADCVNPYQPGSTCINLADYAGRHAKSREPGPRTFFSLKEINLKLCGGFVKTGSNEYKFHYTFT